ncbi:CTP synthase C-terminal region-related (seleno)protein [Sporomusa sp.]|uniref:CTP synthase C-terminal region-related (seleno)protein n=1 Tax=Sporomusa sp. TaxID=2078658 RepID=UPI002CD36DED|nr:glutamine amidotransferase [Sporomusa sp.]HWR43904.1 glutamine amidotransferase [Sporomusa sp.]
MGNFIKIGIIGDFESERPSHKATNEALNHCADYLRINLELQWLPTELLERDTDKSISKFDGLWCAPGVYKSMKGALNAIQFAREKDYPFIGTCAGFQHTVIEYARNKLGLNDAQHAEYDPHASNLIITALSCSLVGETRKIFINKNSRIYKFYNKTEVEERFSCNFGLNPNYRKLIDENGFKVVGTDEKGEVRILELPQNKFFIATLFQPQLSSLSTDPHKLILAYLACTKEFQLLLPGLMRLKATKPSSY